MRHFASYPGALSIGYEVLCELMGDTDEDGGDEGKAYGLDRQRCQDIARGVSSALLAIMRIADSENPGTAEQARVPNE